jgi:hypothetical protein
MLPFGAFARDAFFPYQVRRWRPWQSRARCSALRALRCTMPYQLPLASNHVVFPGSRWPGFGPKPGNGPQVRVEVELGAPG